MRRIAIWAGLVVCVLFIAIHVFSFCKEVQGGEPLMDNSVFVGIEVITSLFGVVISKLIWWDRRRRLPLHCKKCGYNLTGNVSGKCPECGRDV